MEKQADLSLATILEICCWSAAKGTRKLEFNDTTKLWRFRSFLRIRRPLSSAAQLWVFNGAGATIWRPCTCSCVIVSQCQITQQSKWFWSSRIECGRRSGCRKSHQRKRISSEKAQLLWTDRLCSICHDCRRSPRLGHCRRRSYWRSNRQSEKSTAAKVRSPPDLETRLTLICSASSAIESSPVAQNNAVASTITSVVQVTKTYDAITMSAAPTGIPPLETGNWQLPWGAPSQGDNGCVPDDQYAAWSCAIGDLQHSQIIVEPASGGTGSKISIVNEMPPQGDFPNYGTQAPSVLKNQTLRWAADVNNQSLGPAAFFQSIYNKVVIIPSHALNASSGNQRRDVEDGYSSIDIRELDTRDMNGPQVAAGDTPWYCYWNNTLVEGFIYMTQNASDAQPNANGGPSGSGYIADSGQNLTGPPAPDGPPGHNEGGSPFTPKRDGGWQPPFFSKILKVEERRDPDWISSAPYCQQMQVLDDGRVGAVLDPQGDPVVVSLQETKGSYKAKARRSHEERSPDTDWSKCDCQWILPNP